MRTFKKTVARSMYDAVSVLFYPDLVHIANLCSSWLWGGLKW